MDSVAMATTHPPTPSSVEYLSSIFRVSFEYLSSIFPFHLRPISLGLPSFTGFSMTSLHLT